MSLVFVLNILIVLCLGWCFITTIRIYRCTKARSIGWLMAAWAYMIVWRSIIMVESYFGDAGVLQKHSSFVIWLFYPLVALGMWELYKSLRGVCKSKDDD